MIKKGLLTLLVLVLFTNIISAQKHNVVNASIALRNEEYVDAKKYIDEAYETESTSNDAKMWNYRSQIYLQIALKKSDLDTNAIFKATEAHLKCLQTDKKGRVIVRKWTAKEDVLARTIQCGYKLFNKAIEEYNIGNYKSSLKHYAAISEIIPLDTEDQLKRGNITRETILYNSFFSSSKLKDNAKSKELLQQLVDINFNEPAIFVHMSSILIEEGETDKALEYLALGRESFEEDQGLINTEINLYIQLGRTSELIGKLGEAIALDEENELLYFNRGTIYDQEGDINNAEKDYITAIALNPSAFGANYNLGALYFNQGVETKNKANATSNNSLYEKLNNEADAVFAKALPFLETAHNLNADDKNTLLSLKQLYYLKSDYAKSEKMKKLITELK
jgi:Flp pilus assembly protein TadD|tara:strand:- start:202 stop:1380 length:1179 start_codon:yes stop_codon:yes gene_type:complete